MTDLVLTAGSGISIAENASASTITINNESHKKTCVIPLNTTTALAGTEINYFRIPTDMNNWYLIDVQASCSGSSTSGSPAFSVARSSASGLNFVSMASVKIDEGEFDSLFSSTPVISASQVLSGDKIKVYTSASTCGSSVTWAQISLTFRGV